MSFSPNCNKRVGPKNEHKQRGRRPNGDSKTDDEVKHGFNLLSFFWIYYSIGECKDATYFM